MFAAHVLDFVVYDFIVPSMMYVAEETDTFASWLLGVPPSPPELPSPLGGLLMLVGFLAFLSVVASRFMEGTDLDRRLARATGLRILSVLGAAAFLLAVGRAP